MHKDQGQSRARLGTGHSTLALALAAFALLASCGKVIDADKYHVDESGGTSGTCVPTTPHGVCGVAPQCGCQSGENCILSPRQEYGTWESLCIEAGTAPAYHMCEADADCQVGLSCLGDACIPYCDHFAGEDACVTPEASCRAVYDSNYDPIPGYYRCDTMCDPTDPQGGVAPFNACGPGLSCGIPDNEYGSFCHETGTGSSGSTCGTSQDCAPGLSCVPVDSAYSYSCRAPCKVGISACPDGTACKPLVPPRLVHDTEFGYCP